MKNLVPFLISVVFAILLLLLGAVIGVGFQNKTVDRAIFMTKTAAGIKLNELAEQIKHIPTGKSKRAEEVKREALELVGYAWPD